MAHASRISVEEPLPFNRLPSTSIDTKTSPSACFPGVTAVTLNSFRTAFIPTAFSIALKIASTGPSPVAASSATSSSLSILTVAVGTEVFPDITLK